MSSLCEDDKIIIRSCRICLDSQSRRYIRLHEGNKWLRRFEYCFNLTLKARDLPQRVCYKCAVKLKKFCIFKKKCQSSQQLWKYLTVVKCRINRIPLKDEKDAFLYDGESVDSNFDNFNLNNNINFTDIINKNELLDNVKEETGILFHNEDRDSFHDKNDELPLHKTKPKGNFTCSRCSKTYSTNKWYVKHLESCNAGAEDKILPVPTCQHIKTDSYVNPNTYKSSQKIYKRKSSTHFCGICEYTSTSLEEVIKHLDEHWINRDLRCQMCEFIAKDQAGLAAHRYNHYEPKFLRGYICHICQKKTKSQLTLQFHYRKDHLNKPGGLCSQPNCKKVYNCWRLWKKHEKIHIHPGFICDICGQKYKYKHLIVAHLINHTNPSTHVCDVCGKVFSQMRSLKVHLKNVHQTADPVKCSHCNRLFKNELHLRVHKRRIAREKTLKCEFCPMEYSMLSQLNSHLKSHSEERPHCCHICGSRYKAKSQLVIHMRNHSGDRPYKCVLCIKAFTSATQLKVHTMSHTGILPFKCLHCEKAFRSKKRLLGHCAVQHKP